MHDTDQLTMNATVGNADGAQRHVRRPVLFPSDLMRFERELCEGLLRIVSFTSHSLHFPVQPPRLGRTAEYLAEEDRLLLPLYTHERFLALFVARGLDRKAISAALPTLPAFCDLLVQNLALFKEAETDALTGLRHRDDLLDAAARIVRGLRETMRPGGTHLSAATQLSERLLPGASSGTEPATGGNHHTDELPGARQFALLALRINNFGDIVRKQGYVGGDAVLAMMGDALDRNLPDGAWAARSADHEFLLLLPGYGQRRARETGHELLEALESLRVRDAVTGRSVSLSLSAGYALAPQNMEGMDGMGSQEQVRQLLRRARLAAALAATLPRAVGVTRLLGYADMLRQGGQVITVAPMHRMLISLGRSCGTREGMVFSLWSGGRASAHKGDVIVQEAGENTSWAELINTVDPSSPPEPGDRLRLLEASGIAALSALQVPAEKRETVLAKKEPGHNRPRGKKAKKQDSGRSPLLFSYSEFIPLWSREREAPHVFSMALLQLFTESGGQVSDSDAGSVSPGLKGYERLDNSDEEELPEVSGSEPCASGESELADTAASRNGQIGSDWERLLPQAAVMLAGLSGAPDSGGLFCRLGFNTLLWFAPNLTPEKLARACDKKLPQWAAKHRVRAALGIAGFPFLNFSRLDSLDNARKALDYASLLPEPHIGVLDSLALNIAADRLFSRGDVHGAIEEYKRALLCDDGNILAWNSLGVALAGLGKQAEAKQHFSQALQRDAKDLTALYNLGHLCQSAGDMAEARSFYEQCLILDPDHMYARYRMGQLAESAGCLEEARACYLQAQKAPGGQALTRRSIARLLLKEGKAEEAREVLHEALRLNPDDALSLHLLAGIYLDAGEDPSVAESLARQSVALRPDLKATWLALARALETSGNEQAARAALLRAGELA